MDLLPDVDYASVAAATLTEPIRPEELGSHLSRAWAQTYRSRLPQTSLLEFDSDGARFLFDLASAAGAERADRTVAAWGRSRPAPRPRDQAYQRGYPDTLWSMNSLAATRWELGDLQGARELLEQTLTRRQRVLGDDHPDTLTSMNDLAVVRRELGEL